MMKSITSGDRLELQAKWIFSAILLAFFSLSSSLSFSQVSPNLPLGKTQMRAVREALIDRRDTIKTWAYTCPQEINQTGESNPDENSESSNGLNSYLTGEFTTERNAGAACSRGGQDNVNLFSGIGCLAASLAGDHETEQALCDDVFRSQVRVAKNDLNERARFHGRWLRNPRAVTRMLDQDVIDDLKANRPIKEIVEEKRLEFSRDEGLGLISFFVRNQFFGSRNEKIQNFLQAYDWVRYIDRDLNGQRMCELTGIGSPCNIFQGVGFSGILYRALEAIRLSELERQELIQRNQEQLRPLIQANSLLSNFPVANFSVADSSGSLLFELMNRFYKGYNAKKFKDYVTIKNDDEVDYNDEKVDPRFIYRKKLKHRSKRFFRENELATTRPSFNLHLKQVELMNHMIINALANVDVIVQDSDFEKSSRRFHRKDPQNPINYFFNFGIWSRKEGTALKWVDTEFVNKVLNLYCPAKPLEKRRQQTAHSVSTSYWIQRASWLRRWEISTGHDCIHLINMMLADLDTSSQSQTGNDFLPNNGTITKPTMCRGFGAEEISLNHLPVCRSMGAISYANCTKRGGLQKILHQKQMLSENELIEKLKSTDLSATLSAMKRSRYCLVRKSNYYKARPINKGCPFGWEDWGFYDPINARNYNIDEYLRQKDAGLLSRINPIPVCRASFAPFRKMRKYKCFTNKNTGSIANLEHPTPHCLLRKEHFYARKEFSSRECPDRYRKVGEHPTWRWPICERIGERRRVSSRNQCKKSGESFLPKESESWVVKDFGKICIVQRDGYFRSYDYGKGSQENSDTFGKTTIALSGLQVRFDYKTVKQKTIYQQEENETLPVEYNEVGQSGRILVNTTSEKKGDRLIAKILYRLTESDPWQLVRSIDYFEGSKGMFFDDETFETNWVPASSRKNDVKSYAIDFAFAVPKHEDINLFGPYDIRVELYAASDEQIANENFNPQNHKIYLGDRQINAERVKTGTETQLISNIWTYPNPVRPGSRLNISGLLQKPARLNISLYTIDKKNLVFNSEFGENGRSQTLAAEEFLFDFEIPSSLTPGIYLLMIQANDSVLRPIQITKQIVIL